MSEIDETSSVTRATQPAFAEALPFAADTGPLIALARIERLQLLPHVFGTGVVPPAVHREAQVDSDRPGARRIGEALSAGWLQVAALADDAPFADLRQQVDAGEAEAIMLCLQGQARLLLIDDAKGRRVARRVGIPLVGVAGALLAAKRRGLLDAVGPALDDLAAVGYRLSRQLVDDVRHRANE